MCVLLLCGVVCVGCKNQYKNKTETALVLGTVCTLNAFEDASPALYKEAVSRLFALDAVFNANDPASEISCVNATAAQKAVGVSEDFARVLEKALFFAKETNGAFDPSIGPLVQLWNIQSEQARVPLHKDIEDARALVDWRKVSFNPNEKTVFFEQNGMALDLGGIAKGYAADELAALFEAKKVKRAIIDLGGNIYVFGAKKDGSPWRVGIKDPTEPEGLPALVLETSGMTTVVTSGVYERYFIQDDIRYHHILDPKTGYPAQRDYESVTIVTASSLEADALSTAVFLLGANFVAQKTALGNARVIFISQKSGVTASASLQEQLSPLSGHFSSIIYAF